MTHFQPKKRNETKIDIHFMIYILDNFDDSCKLRGGVYFVDDLPSTPSGKVIRRLAKGIAEKEFGSRKIA